MVRHDLELGTQYTGGLRRGADDPSCATRFWRAAGKESGIKLSGTPLAAEQASLSATSHANTARSRVKPDFLFIFKPGARQLDCSCAWRFLDSGRGIQLLFAATLERNQKGTQPTARSASGKCTGLPPRSRPKRVAQELGFRSWTASSEEEISDSLG